MAEHYDCCLRARGAFGALSMQSDFDKAVKRDDPKTKMVVPKQPKKQNLSAQKILDDSETHNFLQEKLYKKV